MPTQVAKFINIAMIPGKVEADSVEEAAEKSRDVFSYPDIIDDNVNLGQVEFEKSGGVLVSWVTLTVDTLNLTSRQCHGRERVNLTRTP